MFSVAVALAAMALHQHADAAVAGRAHAGAKQRPSIIFILST